MTIVSKLHSIENEALYNICYEPEHHTENLNKLKDKLMNYK